MTQIDSSGFPVASVEHTDASYIEWIWENSGFEKVEVIASNEMKEVIFIENRGTPSPMDTI